MNEVQTTSPISLPFNWETINVTPPTSSRQDSKQEAPSPWTQSNMWQRSCFVGFLSFSLELSYGDLRFSIIVLQSRT